MKSKMNKLVQLSAVLASAAIGGFAAQTIMPQKADAHDYQYNLLTDRMDGDFEVMESLAALSIENRERIEELEAEIKALKQ